MNHSATDYPDKEDSHGGTFSDSIGIQTYSLNTSLGGLHIMSRLNNEMSLVDDAAAGSFGVVQKGIFDLDRHCYALKQTKRMISGEGDLQQRLQEVYALSACNHPNILRYFDAWVEDKTVYVRTEWFSEKSIATFNRPVPVPLLYSLLHQIASALHWLSCHHIAHQDVKPENILARRMEDGTYTFKLADFGLVRPLFEERLDTGERFHGTNDDDGDKRYLCPEAFAMCPFSPQHGEADVYALGASCVELMGGDPSLVRSGQYTGEFSSYSPELQQLVRQMTRSDPKERPDPFTVAQSTLPPQLLQSSAEEIACRQASLDKLRDSVKELEKELEALETVVKQDEEDNKEDEEEEGGKGTITHDS
ncbi:protein kinase [Trypanosoma theileri]|uniref:Protein kinase n=1 Tax=Trypanosoma theileri TaxID=67003 RepID=A0A1X0P9V2_9TRYP|nr:protein kinase [Trypanosoma theileri]ORC93413.1 protein kinase [Trypanosoma theileri]